MTNVYITKTGFIENESIFKFFKDIATTVVEEHIESIDEGLQTFIYLLNKFPGIATRWSCTGHPEHPNPDDFHITAVVHDRASFDILEEIVYQYNLKLTIMTRGEAGDDFGKHLRIIKQGMLITEYNGQSLVYPVVSIESWFGPITEPSFLHMLRHEILTKLIQLNKDKLHDVLSGVMGKLGAPNEEVKELQSELELFDRVEDMFNSLYDTLSDYRMDEHPRHDRQAIIEAIMQIEEYGDYLNDENREELSRIKEEIKGLLQ